MRILLLLISTFLVTMLSSISVSLAKENPDSDTTAFEVVECPAEAKPAIMIVEGDNQKPEQFEYYAETLRASGLYEKLGAYYVTVGDPNEVFEGEWIEQKFMVVVRFPCLQRAQQFWHSDTYKAIKPLREGAGDVRSLVFEEYEIPEGLDWLD